MADRPWQDMIVGERMQVDQEFTHRIADSRFTRQEWGLIMTAVDFGIEDAGGNARLVADTSKVPSILPELERVRQQMPGGGGGGGPSRSRSPGLFSSIKSALSLGDGNGADEETLSAARTLVKEYTSRLQTRLEETGKWDQIKRAAE